MSFDCQYKLTFARAEMLEIDYRRMCKRFNRKLMQYRNEKVLQNIVIHPFCNIFDITTRYLINRNITNDIYHILITIIASYSNCR